MQTLVIAEAGVNHNGSLDLARQLIDAAADVGADVVKFQTFRSDQVISGRARKARYQEVTTGQSESQLEMVRKLELDEAAHRELVAHCARRGIPFLSTPFDVPSVAQLQRLGLMRYKVSSGDVTNALLLEAVGRTGRPCILSTGMSTLGDVEGALGVLAAAYLGDASRSPEAAFRSPAGQALLRERVTLLHCTTEYPAPVVDVNLRAMGTLAAAFHLSVGYSDHSEGISVPLAAVALGATIIEKHFTLDRSLPGPDHKASLAPETFRQMIEGIRTVEAALGSPLKVPSPSEIDNMIAARRSLVAALPIKRGEPFTRDNLTAKRPGDGISPMRIGELLGMAADRDYHSDDPIER